MCIYISYMHNLPKPRCSKPYGTQNITNKPNKIPKIYGKPVMAKWPPPGAQVTHQLNSPYTSQHRNIGQSPKLLKADPGLCGWGGCPISAWLQLLKSCGMNRSACMELTRDICRTTTKYRIELHNGRSRPEKARKAAEKVKNREALDDHIRKWHSTPSNDRVELSQYEMLTWKRRRRDKWALSCRVHYLQAAPPLRQCQCHVPCLGWWRFASRAAKRAQGHSTRAAFSARLTGIRIRRRKWHKNASSGPLKNTHEALRFLRRCGCWVGAGWG
jgi:hypothetical protein